MDGVGEEQKGDDGGSNEVVIGGGQDDVDQLMEMMMSRAGIDIDKDKYTQDRHCISILA